MRGRSSEEQEGPGKGVLPNSVAGWTRSGPPSIDGVSHRRARRRHPGDSRRTRLKN